MSAEGDERDIKKSTGSWDLGIRRRAGGSTADRNLPQTLVTAANAPTIADDRLEETTLLSPKGRTKTKRVRLKKSLQRTRSGQPFTVCARLPLIHHRGGMVCD